MSEGPKKIWFDIEECSAGPVKFADDEIPYIRADIVDELVEALEGLIESTAPVCEDSYGHEMEDTYNKARAALAKARGENNE